MSRLRPPRHAVVVGLAAALLVATAGCSGERGRPTTACRLTAIIRPEMRAAGVTFHDLVTGDPDEHFVTGMASALTLLATRTRNVEAEYRPLIDFLVDRFLAEDPQFGRSVPATTPPLTKEVAAGALRLDAAIAAGTCR